MKQWGFSAANTIGSVGATAWIPEPVPGSSLPVVAVIRPHLHGQHTGAMGGGGHTSAIGGGTHTSATGRGPTRAE